MKNVKCLYIICPNCDHKYTQDDMSACNTDLWGLAPDEGREKLECPACNLNFFVQGGYSSEYTTAINEDDL